MSQGKENKYTVNRSQGSSNRTSLLFLSNKRCICYRGEMDGHKPHCPLGLALVQKLGAVDEKARRLHQPRLRQLLKASAIDVCIFCAHDPVEFERQL